MNKVVLEQIYKVLHAEQGVPVALGHNDLKDPLLDLVVLHAELPLDSESLLPIIAILLVFYCVLGVNNFRHFLHLSCPGALVFECIVYQAILQRVRV